MDICSFVLLKDKVSDANLIAIKNKIEKLEADGHKIDILSGSPRFHHQTLVSKKTI